MVDEPEDAARLLKTAQDAYETAREVYSEAYKLFAEVARNNRIEDAMGPEAQNEFRARARLFAARKRLDALSR